MKWGWFLANVAAWIALFAVTVSLACSYRVIASLRERALDSQWRTANLLEAAGFKPVHVMPDGSLTVNDRAGIESAGVWHLPELPWCMTALDPDGNYQQIFARADGTLYAEAAK